MRQLLHRALALALASAASLVLLSSVASLADSDRAALAQARQAQAVLVAARADAVRRYTRREYSRLCRIRVPERVYPDKRRR